MKGVIIYNQPKPILQDSKNIVNFSCGNGYILAVNSDGEASALGSNDLFQLGIPAEKLTKTFKKIDTKMLGDIQKCFCVNDCTFLVNTDNEVYFCGRYSLKSKYII